jgi:hypothetical protein
MYQDGMPSRNAHVDQLAKEAAELALRLAALPADDYRKDAFALDAIEQLATRVLKEISAIRVGRNRSLGETSGMWRAMQPPQRL